MTTKWESICLLIIGGRLHKCQGAHVEVREETILTFHFAEAESHVSCHCIIILQVVWPVDFQIILLSPSSITPRDGQHYRWTPLHLSCSVGSGAWTQDLRLVQKCHCRLSHLTSPWNLLFSNDSHWGGTSDSVWENGPRILLASEKLVTLHDLRTVTLFFLF